MKRLLYCVFRTRILYKERCDYVGLGEKFIYRIESTFLSIDTSSYNNKFYLGKCNNFYKRSKALENDRDYSWKICVWRIVIKYGYWCAYTIKPYIKFGIRISIGDK